MLCWRHPRALLTHFLISLQLQIYEKRIKMPNLASVRLSCYFFILFYLLHLNVYVLTYMQCVGKPKVILSCGISHHPLLCFVCLLFLWHKAVAGTWISLTSVDWLVSFRDLLVPTFLAWDYKHVLPCPAFYVGLGQWTQVLVLASQTH